jgi:hypothetical protein
MDFVTQAVDELSALIESVVDSPEGVRSTATYQFMLQLRDRLIEGGIDKETAERLVPEMQIQLSPDFHIDYHEQFARLIDVFANAIINISHVTREDWDNDEVLITFAKQFTVQF